MGQTNYACISCGRVFGRRYSAKRHLGLVHRGYGRVVSFAEYVRMHSGAIPAYRTSDGQYSKRRKVHSDRSKLKHDVKAELYRRRIQYLADERDPVKQAELGKQRMNELMNLVLNIERLRTERQNSIEQTALQMYNFMEEERIREKYREKATVEGYRAMVCEKCFYYEVQAIVRYGSEAQGYKTEFILLHSCDEKNLERARYLDKDVEIAEAWKSADDALIRIYSGLGRKKKLALKVFWPTNEEEAIDLGSIEQKHWFSRVLHGPTFLTDLELRDFLRKAHATEGTFRAKINGELKVATILLVHEWSRKGEDPNYNDQSTIIGYQGYICADCLAPEVLVVRDYGREIKVKQHTCDPVRLCRALLDTQEEKKKRIRQLKDQLTKVLALEVKKWCKGQPYLHAKKMERREKPKPIDLHYPDNEHWAARAIKYGVTVLHDNELVDFLKMTTNTCAIFKMEVRQGESFYLMMLSDKMMP